MSVWGGMSGAAIWASGRLIGVIAQHYVAEGAQTLTAWPANAEGTSSWASQVPNFIDPSGVTPTSRRALVTRRSLRAALQLAPPLLLNRATDLTELDRFATGDERWRWIHAKAFAGKTALMAWWSAHQQSDKVVVVACFLRRTRGENTAEYVIEVLSEQLAVLADPPREVEHRLTTSAAADVMLHELLPAAAQAVENSGRRLVILVDGLDEYSNAIGKLSPSDWLPAVGDLPSSTALLVASREDVPIDLGVGHPLEQHQHKLGPVAIAGRIQVLAREEIKLALADEHSLAYRVLGFLAATGAGVSIPDLAYLMGIRDPGVEQPRIATVCEADLRRTISGADALGTYAFSHDALRSQVLELFPEKEVLFRYRADLNTWADDFAERGWPIETPHYLLVGYPTQLAEHHDTDRLVACALDKSRHQRLLAVTGADTAVLDEVRAAIALTQEAAWPDLGSIGKLVYEQDMIAARNANLPEDLPLVWARLGRVDRAEALALAITDPSQRALVLSRLASALTATDPDRAKRLADEAIRIIQSLPRPRREEAVIEVGAAIGVMDLDRGQELAHLIKDPSALARALSRLAETVVATQAERATEIAQQAEAIADSLTDSYQKVRALSSVAAAVAPMNPRWANKIVKRAERDAATVGSKAKRATALAALASAIANTNPGRATRIADRAEAVAQDVGLPGQVAGALAQLGAALAPIDSDRAERLLSRAEADAHRVFPFPETVVEGLSRLVTFLAGPHPDRAEAIARSIEPSWLRERVLAPLAIALAPVDSDRAEAIARSIIDPQVRVRAICALAATFVGRDADRAARTAEEVEIITRSITDPPSLARGLGELARALVSTDLELSERIVRCIPIERDKAMALTTLATHLADANPQEALRLAIDALTMAPFITNRQDQLWAYPRLVAAMAAIEPDKAERFVASIHDPSVQQWAVEELIAALGTTDIKRGAAIARSIVDPRSKALALVRLAAETGRHDPAEATRFINEAVVTAGSSKDSREQQRILTDIANHVVAIDPDRAEDVARSISDPVSRSHALAQLAAKIARTNLERAQVIAESIEHPGLKANAFLELVEVATSTDRDTVMRLANLAEPIGRASAKPSEQANILIGVAAALATFDPSRSGQLMRTALPVAESIIDPQEKAWALEKAAVAEAVIDSDWAETIARSVSTKTPLFFAWSDPEVSHQSLALGSLARVLALADPDRAERIARSIPDLASQTEVLVDIAERLATVGRTDLANGIICKVWVLGGGWARPLKAVAKSSPAALRIIAVHVLDTLNPPQDV